MRNGYKNILIIKPSALGDIVHALPILASLRASFPAAKLTWLVRKEFAPLLECAEGLDEILLFDRKQMGQWYCKPSAFSAFMAFCRELKSKQFDLVLDFQGLFRSGLFARLTGCPIRIGMAEARECAGLFYTHKVAKPANSIHVLDYYSALLTAAGAESILYECPLKAPEKAVESIHNVMTEKNIEKKKYIILIPGSAHDSKCWPTERFAALSVKLHKQYGFDVIAVGTAKEKIIIQNIQNQCNIPLIDLSGRTTIPELLALFAQAGAVVSNDTGPGYIAAATGVPTCIIYGHVNPKRLCPYNRPECVVAIEPDTRPQGIKSSNPRYAIANVTLEMVWNRLSTRLEEASNGKTENASL